MLNITTTLKHNIMKNLLKNNSVNILTAIIGISIIVLYIFSCVYTHKVWG